MKLTIDVPDALYDRVTERAAIDGRAIGEVTIELYEAWLADQGTSATAASVEAMLAGTRSQMTGAEWLPPVAGLGRGDGPPGDRSSAHARDPLLGAPLSEHRAVGRSGGRVRRSIQDLV